MLCGCTTEHALVCLAHRLLAQKTLIPMHPIAFGTGPDLTLRSANRGCQPESMNGLIVLIA